MPFFVLSFLASAQSGKNFREVHNWIDTSIDIDKNRYSDVWGIVNKGKEYAVIGSIFGINFINVSDSSEFGLVDRVAGAYNGKNVIHRDIKSYKNYIYAVCDQGKNISTLQIIDYSFLPDSVHVVYDSDSLISRSHNVFIDTLSALLYSCGRSSMQVISLADPTNPVHVHHYFDSYVHDLYVRADTAYLNCIDDLRIVDFADPKNPEQLFILRDYPNKGANHSGWLNEKGNTYVFADETRAAKVKICDVSDLSKFEIKSMIEPDGSDSSLPHNILIKKNIAYMSYYDEGLQVYDISEQDNPIRIGYFDPKDKGDSIKPKGFWGVYPYLPSGKILVSDMKYGLYVLDTMDGFAVGIPKLQKSKFSVGVYPVPFKDELTIEIEALKKEEVTIEILDIQGRTCFTIQGKKVKPGKNAIELNLGNNLTSQVYMLRIELGDEVISKRVLKNR